MKAAVIVAKGVEEAEALTIIDIIRRGNMQCDMVGFEEVVEGGHHIQMRTDVILSEDSDYDMIILPGGYGGVDTMLESDLLLNILKKMNSEGKYVAAMCAAPIILDHIGLLEGKNYTAYKGYDQKIQSGNYLKQNVVVDGNIVTGFAPASCYAFAYKLLELMGGDALAVKNRMVYFNSFKEVA